MTDLLKRLLELEAKATPGWHLSPHNRLLVLTSMDHPLCEFSAPFHRLNKHGEGLDPELMVALRNAWPTIQKALEQAGKDKKDIIASADLSVEYKLYTWPFHGVRYKTLAEAIKARLDAARREGKGK